MSDRREDILDRLFTVLGQVPGVKGVYRDRGVLQPSAAPAILLLDGEERRITQGSRTHTQMPPAIFVLRPQIAILLPPRDTVANTTLDGVSAPVGADLSSFRRVIVAAVLNDSDLVTIGGASGQVTYDGYTTDMRIGGEIGAFGPFMVFNFSFSYAVDPFYLADPASVAEAQAFLQGRWG